MNVLHINQSDISGGAALAGYRLHQALLQQGINSSLLVGTVQTDDSRVTAIPRRHRIESKLSRFTHRLGLRNLNFVSSFDIPNQPCFQTVDILNFHNLHSTHFSYLAIPKLTACKPAIFTLHDMWSFTGHCAYSFDCTKWKTGCGCCPYPNTYPAIARDSTFWEWRLKNWMYSHTDLTIVTPSRWLAEQADSSMLNRFTIHHIPNGIDPEAYHPHDSDLCRAALGIPSRKKVLMFGADDLRDSRKGGDLLLKALQILPATLKQDCVLLTFGNRNRWLESAIDMPAIHLGYISSDRIKAVAYSAADLFLFPTRADNLPLVLQESMACGTPMISFDVGGVSDLVRPGITGYLARPEDVKDFAMGIEQLLNDCTSLERMSQNCLEIAVSEYSLNLQAERYIDLYKQIRRTSARK